MFLRSCRPMLSRLAGQPAARACLDATAAVTTTFSSAPAGRTIASATAVATLSSWSPSRSRLPLPTTCRAGQLALQFDAPATIAAGRAYATTTGNTPEPAAAAAAAATSDTGGKRTRKAPAKRTKTASTKPSARSASASKPENESGGGAPSAASKTAKGTAKGTAKAKNKSGGRGRTKKKKATAKQGGADRAKKSKKRLAKAKKEKKKKKKPVAKSQTPEQKTAQLQRRLREQALKQPRRLPQTAWSVLLAEEAKASGKIVDGTQRAKELYSRFSPADRERYNHVANQNKAANQKAYREWVLTFAPSEIRQANLARLMLKRRFKNYTKPLIRDGRIPRRPSTAPLRFYKERWASGDYVHLSAPEVVKLLVKEYKDLSPEQKKHYESAHKAEFEEYRRQVRALGLDRSTSTGVIKRKRKTARASSTTTTSASSSPSSATADDDTADNEPEAASAVASASEA